MRITMNHRVAFAALGLAAGVSGSPAIASLSAYEGFDYAVGSSLSAQNGGVGFAGGWASSDATISSGNLSVGSLQTSGHSVLAPDVCETLNRTLTNALGA